jgi:hypothetical protein
LGASFCGFLYFQTSNPKTKNKGKAHGNAWSELITKPEPSSAVVFSAEMILPAIKKFLYSTTIMVSKNETTIRKLDTTTNSHFFLIHATRKHTGRVYKTEEIMRLSEKPSSDNASL